MFELATYSWQNCFSSVKANIGWNVCHIPDMKYSKRCCLFIAYTLGILVAFISKHSLPNCLFLDIICCCHTMEDGNLIPLSPSFFLMDPFSRDVIYQYITHHLVGCDEVLSQSLHSEAMWYGYYEFVHSFLFSL